MSYTISYSSNRKIENMKKGHRTHPWLAAGIVCGGLLLLAGLFPQTGGVLRELLFPITDAATADAFAELVADVGNGEPIAEAVLTFCRQVLENGGFGS